jgi:hypothetical protein
MNEVAPMLPEERRMHCHRQMHGQRGAAAEHELRVLYGRGTDIDELLHRFARELRIGAFKNSPDHEVRARAILRQLTVARLRQSNPDFLAAHGITSRAA